MDKHHPTARARKRLTAALAGTAVIALALSGCASDADSGAASADGRIPLLNFGGFGGGSNPKANYNPYLATALSVGNYLYEPLMMLNEYSCDYEPWLATKMEWTTPSTLVYTLRDGVTFSDGKPFTADDVVFTFEMLKKYPALDTRGAWQSLTSVAKTGDGQVTFSFDGSGASSLVAVNAVMIVPKNLWSTVEDPTTFTNTKPVGTGPMLVGSFSPTKLVLDRNPDYWQASKIRVDKIQFNNSDQGQVDQLKLARGDYDMNAMYIPDIEKSYVSKDREHNKYWFPSGSPISLYMNLDKAPFDDSEFRNAITQAMDKKKIVEDAQQGYVSAASQTSLVLPNAKDWLPTGIPDEGYISYDVEAAKAGLDKAGYKLDGSGKRLGADGKPLSFSIQIPGGWNDWIQAGKIVQKNFQALGISVDMQNPTPEVQGQNRLTGQYDLTFGVRGGSCDMYRNFLEPLASSETAPTGETAKTNEVRWRDGETDRLIDRLRQESDPAEQKKTVGELATIMYEKKPYIPLWYGASWFEYSTKRAVGWPSAEDPYAKPSNMPIILTHLRPAQ
ncbi:ABC transporter substrate-binding protein [Leifsonia xyli subsp. xyli]|uniref:ABC transporter, substrate binding protein n=2 Tax=Leifsonia xyli subsp. xyli TaxID=59736 RepID=Q6ACC9_LEIXX|nr:ABC transporter substrate-binding protein [Leifsonia xyli]AAT89964.1 ABC transporter, substrate binding protein [Leifsonia xyli subsp. xyli str. CTCB07]ODA90054.1 ABC transporter substrate-binding protein [Leifsonia xyli subsp. xyli]